MPSYSDEDCRSVVTIMQRNLKLLSQRMYIEKL